MVAMLFTQLATAAHACPMMTGHQTAGGAVAGMPCAAMMAMGVAPDADDPGLCQQHCQFGKNQQPADAQLAPHVDAPVLLPLFTLAPVVVAGDAPAAWAEHARRLERVPRAPHSILHCCMRL